MKFIALGALFCLVAAVTCDIDLKIDNNGIQGFKYSTDDAGRHTREEKIEADGSVSGSFSYVDANGDMRKTEYKAGPEGFQPSGDISVDKKTAEKAAEIAALAPKAPEVEKTEVKIPASPFTVPLYAFPGIHTPVISPAALPYAYHHFAHPFHYAAPMAPIHYW